MPPSGDDQKLIKFPFAINTFKDSIDFYLCSCYMIPWSDCKFYSFSLLALLVHSYLNQKTMISLNLDYF